jgi:hypothetical protein
MIQDPRTEEEIEADRMRAAEKQTYPRIPAEVREENEAAVTFPSGERLPVHNMTDISREAVVVLFGSVEVPFWSTRDEAYEQLRDGAWRQGYMTYQTGNNQVEIWDKVPQPTGYYLATCSEVGMIENVEWKEQ